MADVLPSAGCQESATVDHVVVNYDDMGQLFASDDVDFVRLSGETVGAAQVTTVEIPGVELVAGAWSWANLTRGSTSPRHTTFEMIPEPRDTFINGVPSRPEVVYTYGPNTDLLDTSPPQVPFMLVSIEAEELARCAEILGHYDVDHASGGFAAYAGAAAEHLQRVTAAFTSVVRNARSEGVHASVATTFHDEVIASALGMICRRERSAAVARIRHLSALEIVMACDDYASRRRYKAITSLGLSQAAGYSERRVRAAFREMTGVSPMHFMRSRAIHEVRREFYGGAVTSVTEAALMWGFTELGRFAQAYRKQFGELPSETVSAVARRDDRAEALVC